MSGADATVKALRQAAETAGVRTEDALLRMQQELQDHLLRDISKLNAVRREIGYSPSPEQAAQLHMRAHDLKGLGSTCGYPIIAVLADQLCRILDDDRYEFAEQAGLIDDHIDAITEAFRTQVRTPEHPQGRRILSDLRRDIENR